MASVERFYYWAHINDKVSIGYFKYKQNEVGSLRVVSDQPVAITPLEEIQGPDDPRIESFTWADFGETLDFETIGHIGPIKIFNGKGKLLGEWTLPDGLFICTSATFLPASALRRQRKGWLLSVPTTYRKEHALRWERGSTDACLLSLGDGRNQAKILKVVSNAALPRLLPQDMVVQDYWSALDSLTMDNSGGLWVRRVEECKSITPPPGERLSVSALFWAPDSTSAFRFVDAAARYRGPQSHAYVLDIHEGKLRQRYAREIRRSWGALRDFAPYLSKDGKSVLYATLTELREARLVKGK